MIFCTVGTQLPFDRLIEDLIRWAELAEGREMKIQVGESIRFSPSDNFKKFIREPEFSDLFEASTIVVSHAGMGNIIRALDLNKPIVVVPRLASLNEHINDHQTDTVEALSGLPNLFLANDFEEFCEAMCGAEDYIHGRKSANDDLEMLIDNIKEFVAS